MVTIRDRDTMKQERVPIDQLERIIREKVDISTALSKL
jgi:glycyl-tRNA synthetase